MKRKALRLRQTTGKLEDLLEVLGLWSRVDQTKVLEVVFPSLDGDFLARQTVSTNVRLALN